MAFWHAIALLAAGAIVAEEITGAVTVPTSGTSLSWTSGPRMFAETREWRKVYTPVIIGTIIIQVNEATNQTITTTSYHSEYLEGSQTMPTPSRVNSAGTRTYGHSATTFTYPENYFQAEPQMTWAAMLPITATGNYSQMDPFPGAWGEFFATDLGGDGTCCFTSYTTIPTPTHTSFKPRTQPIDEEDPKGWLYEFVGAGATFLPETLLESEALSSLFQPTPLAFQYNACMHSMCQNVSWIAVAGPATVSGQVAILATSTTTISIDDSTDFDTAKPARAATSATLAALTDPTTTFPLTQTDDPGTSAKSISMRPEPSAAAPSTALSTPSPTQTNSVDTPPAEPIAESSMSSAGSFFLPPPTHSSLVTGPVMESRSLDVAASMIDRPQASDVKTEKISDETAEASRELSPQIPSRASSQRWSQSVSILSLTALNIQLQHSSPPSNVQVSVVPTVSNTSLSAHAASEGTEVQSTVFEQPGSLVVDHGLAASSSPGLTSNQITMSPNVVSEQTLRSDASFASQPSGPERTILLATSSSEVVATPKMDSSIDSSAVSHMRSESSIEISQMITSALEPARWTVQLPESATSSAVMATSDIIQMIGSSNVVPATKLDASIDKAADSHTRSATSIDISQRITGALDPAQSNAQTTGVPTPSAAMAASHTVLIVSKSDARSLRYQRYDILRVLYRLTFITIVLRIL